MKTVYTVFSGVNGIIAVCGSAKKAVARGIKYLNEERDEPLHMTPIASTKILRREGRVVLFSDDDDAQIDRYEVI